jgi:hypothetical protein
VLGSETGFAVQMSSAGRRLGSALYRNRFATCVSDRGPRHRCSLVLARGSTSIADGKSVGSEEASLRAGLRPPLKLHVHVSCMQLSRRLNDAGMREKELNRSTAQVRTRRKAWSQAAVSSQHCANAGTDATKYAAGSSRRVVRWVSQLFEKNGGDAGTRTRGLCRDRVAGRCN